MNLVERVIGKIQIALFKRDLKDIRRAREWKYHLEHEVPRNSEQLTFEYVRKDIIEAFTRHYQTA